jgi:hypothetical protein
MSPILLHIGFHKTATTYLQTDVFTNAELGFASPWRTRGMWAREKFILDHDEDFDARALRAEFDRDQAEFEPGLTRVFSDERLSGTLFANWSVAAHIPARLKAVFPEAQVLIGVREQRSMIKSSYMQYLRLDGEWPIKEFIRHPDDPRVFTPVMPLDRLKYHRTIGRYQDLFGSQNVFVMPFERLIRDRDALIEDLGIFLGRDRLREMPRIKRNESIGPAGMALLRRANAFVKRAPTVLDRQAPRGWAYRQKERIVWQVGHRAPRAMQDKISQQMKREIAATVGDYYQQSNRMLQDLTGLDLAHYGYDV